jgi:hypothetical protein
MYGLLYINPLSRKVTEVTVSKDNEQLFLLVLAVQEVCTIVRGPKLWATEHFTATHSHVR